MMVIVQLYAAACCRNQLKAALMHRTAQRNNAKTGKGVKRDPGAAYCGVPQTGDHSGLHASLQVSGCPAVVPSPTGILTVLAVVHARHVHATQYENAIIKIFDSEIGNFPHGYGLRFRAAQSECVQPERCRHEFTSPCSGHALPRHSSSILKHWSCSVRVCRDVRCRMCVYRRR